MRKALQLAMAAALLGCRRDGAAPTPDALRDRGAGNIVVARVDGASITASDVARQARLGRQAPRAALEALIDQEVLLREARRRGLAARSDVRLEGRRLAVDRFLEEQFERPFGEPPVDESDLVASYQRQQARFVHPEIRTVMHALAVAPESAPQERARARARAETLAVAAAGREWEPSAFAALAAQQSSGSAPFRVEKIRTARLHDSMEPFARAAFELARPGAASGVVETMDGYHVLLLTAVEPGRIRTFSDARADLLAEVRLERRERAFQQFVEELARRHRVVVNPAALFSPEQAPEEPTQGEHG